MQIQINYGDVQTSDALTNHINEQVNHAMRHCKDRITRVEVHLHDDNAGKAGPTDKRCVMEARPAGFDPIAVEVTGTDLYQTVSDTAKRLHRAVERFVDRHRKH